MRVPLLETSRLSLRALEESDFESYARMCADPEVMRDFLGNVASIRVAEKIGEKHVGEAPIFDTNVLLVYAVDLTA